MDRDEIRSRISGLKVWKRGDQRAPHKPLLLLYALGRCLRGEDRLISYETVDKDLKKLLHEFGPPRKSFLRSSGAIDFRKIRESFVNKLYGLC